MKQSHLLQQLLRVAGIGAAAITVVGMSTGALAGVSNTKHNLTLPSNENDVSGLGTEVCVFCHTPHAADTSAPVPLWNKKLPLGSTFTTYAQMGTATLDAGGTGNSVTTGSVSLACLSCHDGTQAMDNMINAPNAGGYNSDGASPTGGTWSGSRNSGGSMINTSSTAYMLAKDLQNDHPIGIKYCGGDPSYTVGDNTGCLDPDFKTLSRVAGVSVDQDKWYVEASGNSIKDKGDMILYTRDFGSSTWAPSIECGTCHDPHEERKSTTEVAFLRKSQTSSGLCLSCHVK